MKRLTIFLACFTIAYCANAQTAFNPKVAILYPNQIVASDKILADLDIYKKHVEITDELRTKYVGDQLTDNWKTIRTKELEFIADQDFFGNMTFRESSNLTYEVYAYESFPLIFPVRDKSAPNKESYRNLAEKYGVNWVVNIAKLEFSEGSDKQLTATIQLYNSISDRIFINRQYVGGTPNPGGNLDCYSGSWECAANNIVKNSVADIFDILDKYRKFW